MFITGVLPEAQGIRVLTDKRRNLIRSFWQKANKITRQLDGHSFTLGRLGVLPELHRQ